MSFSTMQRALRYSPRLDRAKMATRDLKELTHYYKSLNISATELFKILNRVTVNTTSPLRYECHLKRDSDSEILKDGTYLRGSRTRLHMARRSLQM